MITIRKSKVICSPEPVRTADPGVNSALLYQLSYWGADYSANKTWMQEVGFEPNVSSL